MVSNRLPFLYIYGYYRGKTLLLLSLSLSRIRKEDFLYRSLVIFILAVRESTLDVNCACIHFAASHHVRIVQLLTSTMKSFDYAFPC